MSTLPKDASPLLKKRVEQWAKMNLSDAKLVLRLQVAQDIAAFIRTSFASGVTRQEMETTLDMFVDYAKEGASFAKAATKDQVKNARLLEEFASGCAIRFGGRGRNVFFGSTEFFAANPPLVAPFLQRGLVDLVTKWVSLGPSARKPFVRAVLDSPKNYATTLEYTEDVMFAGGQTAIQKFTAPSDRKMADVLKEWLAAESNDSIYTGKAAGGHRQTARKQLETYAERTKEPEAYHLCWSNLINHVVLSKDMDPKNHNAIISFFKQNVPALCEGLKPSVPQDEVEQFVTVRLQQILENPVFNKEIVLEDELTLGYNQLNRFAEFQGGGFKKAVSFMRAKDADEWNALVKSHLEGQSFTRLGDADVKHTYRFVSHDYQKKQLKFARVHA